MLGDVSAAAKTCGIIPMGRGVCGGAVEAAVSVAVGIDIKAAAKGSGGIGSPFVKIAHHIGDAFGGDTSDLCACFGERLWKLVQALVLYLGKDGRVGGLKVFDSGVDGTSVVTNTGLSGVSVGVGPAVGALTSAQPFLVGA